VVKERKICLVKYYTLPSDETRPVAEFIINGKKQFMEYEIEKIFETEEEARQYGMMHKIRIEL